MNTGAASSSLPSSFRTVRTRGSADESPSTSVQKRRRTLGSEAGPVRHWRMGGSTRIGPPGRDRPLVASAAPQGPGNRFAADPGSGRPPAGFVPSGCGADPGSGA